MIIKKLRDKFASDTPEVKEKRQRDSIQRHIVTGHKAPKRLRFNGSHTCKCGRTISNNKAKCLACSKIPKEEVSQ